MTAECPKDWYTEEQVREWLKRDGYPFNRDLPRFLAKHFQLALDKGWQLRDSKYRTLAAEVEKLLEVAKWAGRMSETIMGQFTCEGLEELRDALAKRGEEGGP